MSSQVRVWSEKQNNFFHFVESETGNAIVEAVAGAGKTTTLVEGARRMKGRVLICAYNKKMADEIAEKIAGIEFVYSGTFHSVGLRALRYANKNIAVDEKKVTKIVDDIVLQRPDLLEYKEGVIDMVSMAKQRGLGALSPVDDIEAWFDMVDQFNLDDSFPENVDMVKITKFAIAVLKRSNTNRDVIDFNDMVYLPLVPVNGRLIRPLQYDWVLVDEAQDTNPTRRALAKRLLKPGGRLVAVGDPHQAIFGFTGADNDALDQIRQEFGCKTLPLSTTYRCPKRVVETAHRWVSHIEAHESAPEGRVVETDYDVIMRAQPGDAILCRYNKYLVEACFKLIRAGVAARIEGRAIGEGLAKLAGRWKVKTLPTLRDRLETYRDREVKKATEKDNTRKVDTVNDQVDTMLVLIDRAESQGITTIAALQEMIKSMFSANGDEKDIVVLCSLHRSKGLEWKTVYIIGLELLPSPMAKLQWQIEQEYNLCYVGVTRAMDTLYLVPAPVAQRKEAA